MKTIVVTVSSYIVLLLASCSSPKDKYKVTKVDSGCMKFYHVITAEDNSNKSYIILSKKNSTADENPIKIGQDYSFHLEKINEPIVTDIVNGDTLVILLASRVNFVECNNVKIKPSDNNLYFDKKLKGLQYQSE